MKYCAEQRLAKKSLNINPIQRGGILTPEAKVALHEFEDGYSVCDYCEGRLDKINKPPIHEFLEEFSKFINVDIVRPTHGAREGKFIVIHSLCEEGDKIVVDGNAHYTTYVAAERNKTDTIVVPHSGYPNYEIKVEKWKETLDNVLDKYDNVKLAILTHVDGNYGNLTDAKKIGKICRRKGIPLLLNCAYTMGRMPINAKKLKADFVVGSGHKSMAASGPIGILGLSEEWEDEILRKSKKYPNKEIELLGCTSRGAPIVTLMASFPHVKERVKNWDQEVKKTRYFVKEMEKIEGIKQLGIKPKMHDLVNFETPIFEKISKKHPKKGYFLYHELKKRNITGVKPGYTKTLKCSVYRMDKEQIDYIINSFREIVDAGIGI